MNKNNNQVLSKEIEIDKIKELQKRVTINADIMQEITDKLVKDYCQQLDEYVLNIKNILQDIDNPPSDEELDDFVLNIPVLLYFTGEGLEALGIREDIAKAIKVESFSQAYEKANIGKATIADKTAQAELESQNEYLVHSAYQRAYRIIKSKQEAGYELLNSCKKVVNRRMQSYELSRVDSQRIGGK